jgi:hypothetical protein
VHTGRLVLSATESQVPSHKKMKKDEVSSLYLGDVLFYGIHPIKTRTGARRETDRRLIKWVENQV